MAPTTPGPDASSGIFSSVLSFVSREVKTFVNSAAGKDNEEEPSEDDEYSEEDEEENQELKTRSESIDRRSKGRTNSMGSSEKMGRRRGTNRRDTSPSLPRNHQVRERVGECSSKARKESIRIPEDNYSEDELSGPDDVSTPSPRPPPARILRRRAAVTMPGSLFERSMSLEPSPETELERHRVVRFASGIESPSADRHLAPLSEDEEECEAGPSNPRQSPSSPKRRNESRRNRTSPRNESSKVFRVARNFSDDAPSVNLMLPRSPDRPVIRANERRSDKGKGKEREAPEIRDEVGRMSRVETSYENRVRGKERELQDAIERENDADDEEERRRDKERIRSLEEEVKKLREELQKRSSTTQVSFIPPPPPPPPPLHLSGSSIRVSSGQKQADGLFSSARASLRPTAPPTENPINPAYAAPSVKRKGQPTINIGADKMADFLKELKTHRLRKVGNSGAADLSLDSSVQPYKVQRPPPALRAREVGGVGNRSEVVPNKVSEISFAIPVSRNRSNSNTGSTSDQELKRKRFSEAAEGALPNKRRILDSSLTRPRDASTMAFDPRPASIPMHTMRSTSSIISSVGSSQSRWTCGMSKSGTELTTPSLCSDTEQGDEPSLEDRVPTTPPLSATRSRSGSISVDAPPLREQRNGHIRTGTSSALDNENIRQARDEARIKLPMRPDPASRTQNASSFLQAPGDMFTSRPPSSPLPFDSPKRPRPPPRSKSRPSQLLVQDPAEEEDDPLALSVPDRSMNHLGRDDASFLGTREPKSDVPVQNSRIPRAMDKRRLPMRPPQKHLLESYSKRQNNLEAELLRANSSYGSYEQEFLDDVYDESVRLESGTLTTVGSRERKDGFIAHGGAGGIPVIMGPGNIDDLEDIEDESLSNRPSRAKRKTSNATGTGRKKGRSRA